MSNRKLYVYFDDAICEFILTDSAPNSRYRRVFFDKQIVYVGVL